MTKYVHIVQVHPVENGKVNLSKVKEEKEFGTKVDADFAVFTYNQLVARTGHDLKAVYRGRVNDSTGELE